MVEPGIDPTGSSGVTAALWPGHVEIVDSELRLSTEGAVVVGAGVVVTAGLLLALVS